MESDSALKTVREGPLGRAAEKTGEKGGLTSFDEVEMVSERLPKDLSSEGRILQLILSIPRRPLGIVAACRATRVALHVSQQIYSESSSCP